MALAVSAWKCSLAVRVILLETSKIIYDFTENICYFFHEVKHVISFLYKVNFV